MRRKIIAVALLVMPLPACTNGQINSAGSKAEVACAPAVRVCEAAGGILGWSKLPSADFTLDDIPASSNERVEP